ncbi:MAG TPA: alpha/beta hydrolase family protein [Mycobacteriales bacterium]|nr:alpha/beta hydrolase family protein [Mycobacteriales bacterium]
MNVLRATAVAALIAVPLALGGTHAIAVSDAARQAGTAAAIHVVSHKRESPRVTQYLVSTPSLGMSSKTPLRIDVILPTGYAAHPDRHYPVLYALPGTDSTADQWVDQTDTLAATKGLALIVVSVDGGYNTDGGGWYTNWVDQHTRLGTADWETFHTREVVPWVDSHFRTLRSRDERAIVGISQGGFGSLSYAARHPDLFGAAAAFSGAVDVYQNPVCEAGASALISAIVATDGVEPLAAFGDPVTDAANWRAHDPGSNVTKLHKTKVDLYVSDGVPAPSDLTDPADAAAGAGLEAVMHLSNECFKEAADAAGLHFGWHEYAVGLHTEPYMNRDLLDYLPRLMRFFAAHRPGPFSKQRVGATT